MKLNLQDLRVSVRKEEFIRTILKHSEPDPVALLMAKYHLGDTIQLSYEDFSKISLNGTVWESEHKE